MFPWRDAGAVSAKKRILVFERPTIAWWPSVKRNKMRKLSGLSVFAVVILASLSLTLVGCGGDSEDDGAES